MSNQSTCVEGHFEQLLLRAWFENANFGVFSGPNLLHMGMW